MVCFLHKNKRRIQLQLQQAIDRKKIHHELKLKNNYI